MRRRSHAWILAAVASALVAGGRVPVAAQQAPPAVRAIDVAEHPGAVLPLDRTVIDESGGRVPLGRFFRAGSAVPVLLVPGYFRCDMLCGVLAPRLEQRLSEVPGWIPGEDYRVILFSIDPREGPPDALERRRQALPDGLLGWSLVTAPEASVRAITRTLGFEYRYDPATDQFGHAAVTVAIAPDGSIARYVYGVDPAPDTLAAVLAAARDRRSAASLERILVRCFRFSPTLRRHADLLANILRGGAALVLLGLAGMFVAIARRGVGGAEGLP